MFTVESLLPGRGYFANGVDLLSLRDVYDLPESHFEIQDEEDVRYLTLGSQMGWDLLGICEDEVSLAEYDLYDFKTLPLYSCRPLSTSILAHLTNTYANIYT